MFGGDVQRDFCQIEVGADTAGGTYAGLLIDILHDPKAKLSGGQPVKRKIVGHVHESLVDGIDMDIFFGDIFQVNSVDIRGNVHIFLHTGRRYDIIHRFRNFKDAAAVFDAKPFHGGGDGQTDGFFCPCGIGYDQIRGHGVKSSGDTLNRGVK